MRSVSRQKISVTPGITCSALRIPLPMGPNPGRWSYGVVAVLGERYGISNHPVTTASPGIRLGTSRQENAPGERPDHDPQPNRRNDPDVISPDQDIRSKEQSIDEGRRFNLHTCRPARGGRCKYAFMERRANSRAGPCRRTRPQALTKPA